MKRFIKVGPIGEPRDRLKSFLDLIHDFIYVMHVVFFFYFKMPWGSHTGRIEFFIKHVGNRFFLLLVAEEVAVFINAVQRPS